MTEREQFNAAYWASKPPGVQALNGMETFSLARMAAAVELAENGHLIDAEIDARGMSAWETMKLREGFGYTWVPSLLQPPVPIAPGIVIPGQAQYDPRNPPAGSIRVSAKIEDYPPFLPPVVEPPKARPPARPCLEISLGPNRAAVIPGDTSPSGTVWLDPQTGKTWIKVLVASPFGAWAWWEVRP